MAATDPTPCTALGALDDPRVEAFGMLVETHNELAGAVGKRLEADLDLPVSWLGVLVRLARSPEGRLRMSELARDMTMSASGLTRLVDRIERAGHVRREACPEDRRGLHAVLTPDGAAAIDAASSQHLDDLERFLAAPLDDGELTQLTDLLRRVRDHIRAAPG